MSEKDELFEMVKKSKWVKRWTIDFCTKYADYDTCVKNLDKISEKYANSLIKRLIKR